MLPQKIQFELVTPERRVLLQEIQEVVLPGVDGYFGVLPGHAPLLSGLEIGEVRYRIGSQDRFLAIGDGFVEVLPEKVSVLVRTAEHADEIDLDRAQRSLERARERIRRWESDLDFWRARSSLQRALTRVQVGRKTS